jgi:exopolysaccharide biosynthesis polyprenyl glycosylphosphotransferase
MRASHWPETKRMASAGRPTISRKFGMLPADTGSAALPEDLGSALCPPQGSKFRLAKRVAITLLIVLSTLVLVHISSVGAPLPAGGHVVADDLGIVLIYAVLIALLESTEKGAASNGRLWSLFKNVTLASMLTAVVMQLSGGGTVTLRMLAAAALLNTTALYLDKRLMDWYGQRPRGRTARLKNVLIVGANRVGSRLAAYLEGHPETERAVTGFLAEDWRRGERVLGSTTDLARIARAEFVDEVIVAMPQDAEKTRMAILLALQQHLDVRVVPELFGCTPASVLVENMGGVPVVPLHEEPIPFYGLRCKRALDVLVSGVGLLLAGPLVLAIAMAVKLDSAGPVFYRAPRLGKKGRPFLFYKFRTMRAEADRLKDKLRGYNERVGPIFKMTADPRVTRVGRFLRRYSLDELPQLWNVLIGDMSLVGPRPHPLDDCERYEPEHFRRLDVTPGITGEWQVSERGESSFENSMALDLGYIENWSLWRDICILFRTVPAVLRGTGV